MRRYFSPKRRLNFNGLDSVISQKIELFITTAVRISYPTYVFLITLMRATWPTHLIILYCVTNIHPTYFTWTARLPLLFLFLTCRCITTIFAKYSSFESPWIPKFVFLCITVSFRNNTLQSTLSLRLIHLSTFQSVKLSYSCWCRESACKRLFRLPALLTCRRSGRGRTAYTSSQI
jgi:hypothetical protein